MAKLLWHSFSRILRISSAFREFSFGAELLAMFDDNLLNLNDGNNCEEHLAYDEIKKKLAFKLFLSEV